MKLLKKAILVLGIALFAIQPAQAGMLPGIYNYFKNHLSESFDTSPDFYFDAGKVNAMSLCLIFSSYTYLMLKRDPIISSNPLFFIFNKNKSILAHFILGFAGIMPILNLKSRTKLQMILKSLCVITSYFAIYSLYSTSMTFQGKSSTDDFKPQDNDSSDK